MNECKYIYCYAHHDCMYMYIPTSVKASERIGAKDRGIFEKFSHLFFSLFNQYCC